MQQYIVKGFFTMAVEAEGWPEARQTAERILRHNGVRAVVVEANENRENGKRESGKRKKRGGGEMVKDLDSFAGYLHPAGLTASEIEHYLEMQEERKRAELEAAAPPNVYQARAAGREYCRTEGAAHYHQAPGAEPLDLIISCDYSEGFCIGGAIKYAGRYRRTRDLDDLKKAVDLLQIYCGVRLAEREQDK